VDGLTALISLVSLLSDYAGRQDAKETKSYGDFMLWLSENHHDELRGLMEQQVETSVSIKALLNESHEKISAKLQKLDSTFAAFVASSGLEHFAALAESTHPGAGLSAQAISLLEQFSDSGATSVLEFSSLAGVGLAVADGPGNYQFNVSDLRFLQDDLSSLVEAGFLDLNYNQVGQRLFVIRRRGAQFVERLRTLQSA
jgi:hypothetical protein